MATGFNTTGGEENTIAVSVTGQDATVPIVAQTPVTTTNTSLTMSFTLNAGELGYIAASISGGLGGTLTGAVLIDHQHTSNFNDTNIWAAEVTSTANVTISWSGSQPGVMVGVIIKPQAGGGGGSMMPIFAYQLDGLGGGRMHGNRVQ